MFFKSSAIENAKIEAVHFSIPDKAYFVELIQENKASFYRLSKSIIGNEADIQDAISETIIKAYTNIHKLKSIDSFKPWVMKMLVNECYSILKKRKKLELTDDFTAFEGSYEDENEDHLTFYINQLEDEFKSVVILFYYEDISIRDIGRILNISEGTVKSRLSRAKAKLKIMLDNHGRSDCIG